MDKPRSISPRPPLPPKNQSYVVETITMTTVTERRIIREAAAAAAAASTIPTTTIPTTTTTTTIPTTTNNSSVPQTAVAVPPPQIPLPQATQPDDQPAQHPPAAAQPPISNRDPITPSGEEVIGQQIIERTTYLSSTTERKPIPIATQISGILKGGKLWKSEPTQVSFFFLLYGKKFYFNLHIYSTPKFIRKFPFDKISKTNK